MEGAYFAPTYGNTLMGLATHRPRGPEDPWDVIYYPPAPRAVIEVVDPEDTERVVEYGQTGRGRLTTLTKEFFMPRFLERDEMEREPPVRALPLGRGPERPALQEARRQRGRGGVLMLHLPILRAGRPVPERPVDQGAPLPHQGDLPRAVRGQLPGSSAATSSTPSRRPCGPPSTPSRPSSSWRSARATADAFMNATLPVGDEAQTPDDYVRQLSATTGLPHVLVRRNMEKIRGVLAEVRTVIDGLTRGLDLEVLDHGPGRRERSRPQLRADLAHPRAWCCPTTPRGCTPCGSPTIALKTALVLKPGSAEPWSPYRLIQAFIKAGAPPEAFGFYPTDHAGLRRDPAPLREGDGLRRRGLDPALAGRPARRGPRAGLQQGAPGAGHRRRLARAPRRDGRRPSPPTADARA